MSSLLNTRQIFSATSLTYGKTTKLGATQSAAFSPLLLTSLVRMQISIGVISMTAFSLDVVILYKYKWVTVVSQDFEYMFSFSAFSFVGRGNFLSSVEESI